MVLVAWFVFVFVHYGFRGVGVGAIQCINQLCMFIVSFSMGCLQVCVCVSTEVTDKALLSQSNIENVAPTSVQNPVSSLSSKPSLQGAEKDAGLRPSSQQSYMSTTTSFRAKVSRSGPQVEGPSKSPLTEEAAQPAKVLGTKASTIQDLNTEHGDFKENLPPAALPPPLAASSIIAAFAPETGSASLPSTPVASVTAASSSGLLPGNHSARAALRLDLSVPDCCLPTGRPSPASLKSRRRTAPEGAARQAALVTPTEMRSLGQEGKRRISTIEDGMTTPRGLHTLSSRASANLPSPASCRSPEHLQARPIEGLPRLEPGAQPRQQQQQANSLCCGPVGSPAVDNSSLKDCPASCSSPLESGEEGWVREDSCIEQCRLQVSCQTFNVVLVLSKINVHIW